MIRSAMYDIQEKSLKIEDVFISQLLDEFVSMYSSGNLDAASQLECLGYINTLFRLKHRFILDYNKEKRTYSRDMQIFHLKKIQRFAKIHLKKVTPPAPRKKYEPTEKVMEFRQLIKALHKKIKEELNDKTKRLLDELMRERWTVQDKTRLLRNILDSKDAKFHDLLESSDSEEIVTSFLALLDMKRNNEVKVIQKKNFGEITILKV